MLHLQAQTTFPGFRRPSIVNLREDPLTGILCVESIENQPSSEDEEQLDTAFCSDFQCCGLVLDSLHDLIDHYEDAHVRLEVPTGSDASAVSGIAPPTQRRLDPVQVMHQNRAASNTMHRPMSTQQMKQSVPPQTKAPPKDYASRLSSGQNPQHYRNAAMINSGEDLARWKRRIMPQHPAVRDIKRARSITASSTAYSDSDRSAWMDVDMVPENQSNKDAFGTTILRQMDDDQTSNTDYDALKGLKLDSPRLSATSKMAFFAGAMSPQVRPKDFGEGRMRSTLPPRSSAATFNKKRRPSLSVNTKNLTQHVLPTPPTSATLQLKSRLPPPHPDMKGGYDSTEELDRHLDTTLTSAPDVGSPMLSALPMGSPFDGPYDPRSSTTLNLLNLDRVSCVKRGHTEYSSTEHFDSAGDSDSDSTWAGDDIDTVAMPMAFTLNSDAAPSSADEVEETMHVDAQAEEESEDSSDSSDSDSSEEDEEELENGHVAQKIINDGEPVRMVSMGAIEGLPPYNGYSSTNLYAPNANQKLLTCQVDKCKSSFATTQELQKHLQNNHGKMPISSHSIMGARRPTPTMTTTAPSTTSREGHSPARQATQKTNEKAAPQFGPGSRAHNSMTSKLTAEEIAERPYACTVPGCEKRYKCPGGIKYHRKHGHPELGPLSKPGEDAPTPSSSPVSSPYFASSGSTRPMSLSPPI